MNIVQVRSPFIIEVNETGQTGSKIELFIWNKGDTEPTVPNYVMSKDIPSASQKANYYNISNFISEFIDNTNAVKTTNVANESNTDWCLFKVKRYYFDDIYILLDTISYVGLNGFTEYTDGKQEAIVANSYLLQNQSIINNWKKSGAYGYFNLLVDTTANDYQIIFSNSISEYIYYVPATGNVNLLKVAYTNDLLSNPNLPCQIVIYNVGDDINEFTINTQPIEECKYIPVECTFINSFGGWQFLTFFKAQSNSINVKGSEYNLLPDNIDYNVYKGQSQAFNINGTKSIKLNTGWVAENYNELIHDLLLSETVLLDNKPAKVKNKSFEYKTDLKDKNINFEIEFEYAFNIINDVV